MEQKSYAEKSMVYSAMVGYPLLSNANISALTASFTYPYFSYTAGSKQLTVGSAQPTDSLWDFPSADPNNDLDPAQTHTLTDTDFQLSPRTILSTCSCPYLY